MCAEVGRAKGALLLLLASASVYMLFVHDRVDYSLLPWNQRPSRSNGPQGPEASWDEAVAKEIATIDWNDKAPELFPSQLSAEEARVGVLDEPPQDEAELEGWVAQVKATQQQEILDSVDKWEAEVAYFAGLRMEQDATWMELERKLNALYSWYKDFYAAMLESKAHVNGMHVAPDEGGGNAEDKGEAVGVESEKASLWEAPEQADVELEPLLEKNLAEELTEEFEVETEDLLARAAKLHSGIAAKEHSIKFVRQQIKGFQKAHKKQTAVLDKVKAHRLPDCEAGLRQRREVLLELHTFLDTIFQHMSDALEAARLEALQTRNSALDGRSAQEEVSDMQSKLTERSPEMSHLLARLMPEARERAVALAHLNVTLIAAQQKAADVDSLMSAIGSVAQVMVPAFKDVFVHAERMDEALTLLAACQRKATDFSDSFERVMKQEAVATGIVRLAAELDDVQDALHPVARETVAGLALQLKNLDGLDEMVASEVHSFKRLIKEEKTLAGLTAELNSFVPTCGQYLRGTDLSLTAARAKIMQYYANHGLYRDTSDGVPEDLKRLDTHDPHPPAVTREVKYDYRQQADGDASSLRFWWRASPPPPPLAPYMG